MKVFISYGDAADQVIALRLQALAAVNGLTVYVPPAWTRTFPVYAVPEEIEPKLRESEVVLAVVANGFAPGCSAEILAGKNLGKQLIVMAYPHFADTLAAYGNDVIVINPLQAGEAERAIVSHLKAMESQKTANGALLALATLALGMLLFASIKKQN